MVTTVKRNSNIELLRIMAMLFILIHHLLVHGLKIFPDCISWGGGRIPYLVVQQPCFCGGQLLHVG